MNSWSFSNAWALAQLLMMIYHRRNHLKFYSWFCQADNLVDSSIRGISTRGYPVFGLLPVPKLSISQFKSSLYLYYLSLLYLIFDHPGSWLWTMTTFGPLVLTFITGISFILWICISGSLWAEESLCYHREVLATIVHIYLMLWPSSLNRIHLLSRGQSETVLFNCSVDLLFPCISDLVLPGLCRMLQHQSSSAHVLPHVCHYQDNVWSLLEQSHHLHQQGGREHRRKH